jgi:hypothetical protein
MRLGVRSLAPRLASIKLSGNAAAASIYAESETETERDGPIRITPPGHGIRTNGPRDSRRT